MVDGFNYHNSAAKYVLTHETWFQYSLLDVQNVGMYIN